MILDDKVLVLSPPPPYTKATATPAWRTFSALPPHLLLQIVYATFSDAANCDGEDPREQRKTLYWLALSLRRVNRLFYTTSMSVLRSIYLPTYDSLIREPYTSDPFPHSHSQSMRASLRSLQRETTTLDLFISLKVREDVWADDSELHLERDESFTDLFNLMQPRARLEDLVRDYGVTEGLVYIDSHRKRATTPNSSFGSLRSAAAQDGGPPTSVVLRSAASYAALTARLSAVAAAAQTKSRAGSSSFWWMGKGKAKAVEPLPLPSTKVTISPLPFSALSVTFSSRRIGLVLTAPGHGRSIGSRRTVVEVSRARNEALEIAAQRLIWGLRDWLVDEADGL